jgi:hypothetical protein
MAASLPPKIVYPSGGGTTLSFQYYPRDVAAYDYAVERRDNSLSGGQVESVYTRTDTFLEIVMEWVGNSVTTNEIAGWYGFMKYALQGGAFDYYTTQSVPLYTTYILEDTTWEAAYKNVAAYTFRVRFRQVIPVNESDMFSTTTVLSTTQLKNLNSTPVVLVPAQGSNTVIEPVIAFLQYVAGATPFTIGSASSTIIKFTGSSTALITFHAPTGFFDQSTNQISSAPVVLFSAAQSVPASNSLQVAQGGGNMSAGNGSAVVTVFYNVIALS